MKKQPFFAKRGDAFIPNPVSNGPWDPNSMHGRVVIGLLAHVIEQRHGSDDFVPARLTVDMFRLPDIMTPVEVTTKLIRDGKRIKVVEAEFFSGGTAWRALPASCCAGRKMRRAMSGRRRTGTRRCRIHSRTDRSTARHERQMDDAADRRPHGLARVAAAVDERGARDGRGHADVAVRPCRDGADFASPFANAGDQGSATSTATSRSICTACR